MKVAEPPLVAAVVVASAALGMGLLRLPQPFLGVLAACLLYSRPPAGVAGWAMRCAAGWSGAVLGAVLLIALPQQPWISLPLFGFAVAAGHRIAVRAADPSGGMLFLMGMAASFPPGVVVAADGVLAAAIHGTALTVGCVAASLAGGLIPHSRGTATPASGSDAGDSAASLGIALAAMASVTFTSAIFSSASVVMTVATVVTVDALSSAAGRTSFVQRLVGAGAGATAGVFALVLTSGAGNGLALYLGVLAAIAGACEAIARRCPQFASGARQAAAMFVVVATTFPRPAESVGDALSRAAAVVLGVLLAGLALAVARLAMGASLRSTQPCNQGVEDAPR